MREKLAWMILVIVVAVVFYGLGLRVGVGSERALAAATSEWAHAFELRRAALTNPRVGEDAKLDTLEKVQLEFDVLHSALKECREGHPVRRLP